MRESLYDYLVRTDNLSLLDEWDAEQNAPVTPHTITFGSDRKMWWRCSGGHTWQASVYSRASVRAGCPYCTGRHAWPGETDLATRYPDLAAEWCTEKNGELTPDTVLPGSHLTVWWRCSEGHTWKARVNGRVAGSGCPVCANRKLLPGANDLAAAYPELVAQWHPTKNGKLTPEDVVSGSRRKVWWICEHGHEWSASVASRVGGAGCPVCAGKVVIPGENDLASLFPAIAAQWHPEKNHDLMPDAVSPYSNRKVWWRCNLGHDWLAAVASRTSRDGGCPYCGNKKVLKGFNDLAFKNPQVAAQWHPTLNGNLTPEMVVPGSHKRVWWECPNGHVWKAIIFSRAGPQQCGCPVCAGKRSEKQHRRYDLYLSDAFFKDNRGPP